MTRLTELNDRVAERVTALTGNMWFFWVALAFILTLRLVQPPPLSALLLDLENDLQLLLLATAAVVSGKQFALLLGLVRDIRTLVGHVDRLATHLEAEVAVLEADAGAPDAAGPHE